VRDGYICSRVARVAADGAWPGSFGSPGGEPGQLMTPHSIAVDAKDNVYVADRGNRRIQVFDTKGALQRVITIDVPYDSNARPAIGDKPNLPFPHP
jgi:sugar lactone lactonase YvrE